MSSVATAVKYDREIVPEAARTGAVETLSGYGNETFAYTCRSVAVLLLNHCVVLICVLHCLA
jgi:hypothetical protein